MKQIIAGGVVTVVILLALVYFTPMDGASEASSTPQRRAPQSESFNLN